MVVAIDGPAGSGKSTVAKIVAETLHITYLNTGKMYRGIALKALRNNCIDNIAALKAIAQNVEFDLAGNDLVIDGCIAGAELHTDQVDAVVSAVSAISELRDVINNWTRSIAGKYDIVVEGRDTTSVIFPDTPYKFFIDASADARAKRRFSQGTSTLSFDEIYISIQKRDKLDREKPVGSLKIVNDATYIDSSALTIEEVCAKVLQSIQEKPIKAIRSTRQQ